MPVALVLASSSRYRRRLLERLGLPFEAAEHRADESRGPRGEDLRDIPARLAAEKARSLRGDHPGAHIIGSDQLVIAAGQILGKPGSREAAREQLERLSGATHELVTSVTLDGPNGAETRTVIHRMTMRPLAREEIERYLDADRPFDCCGSYKIEQRGIALFEAIAGDDSTAIEGLPLIALSQLLRAAGFRVP